MPQLYFAPSGCWYLI